MGGRSGRDGSTGGGAATDGGDDGAGSHDRPNDTMRERLPGSRLGYWLLLDASRLAVAAVLAVGVFASLVVLGGLDPSPLRGVMTRSDPMETLFQAYVTSIITGVTLVLTINQLVLSQELGSAADQRDRMEGAMAFRTDVEDVLGVAASPPEPSAFLRALVDVSGDRARALVDAIPDGCDRTVRDRIERYVDGLTANAEDVSDRLTGSQFGTFGVVSAALDFNYSWKIYEARRLRNENADELGEEAEAAFDDLVGVLELFGPAREHFKTLYFQWELIDLSRAILYAAVPALVATSAAVLYLDSGAFPGETLGIDNLVWVVSATSTLAVLPFALLLSYILRIAIVAKHTLSIGPFILRETDRPDDADRADE